MSRGADAAAPVRGALPAGRVGLVLLVAATTVAAALWLAQHLALRQQRREVARILALRVATAELLSTLVDAETGERGFTITGQRAFLEPYQHALAVLPGHLATLEAMVEGAPLRQALLARIRPLVARELAFLRRIVGLREREGREAAARLLATGEGKRNMDALRVIVAELQRSTDGDLAACMALVERTDFRMTILFGFTGAGLAMSGGWLFKMRREHQYLVTLGAQEERFRATFEQAAVGVALLSPEGRWLRVNRRLCEILGYAPGELEAMTFADVTHPDDLAADWSLAHDLVAGKCASYQLEKRYRRKDRATIWVNLTCSAVRGPDGRADYVIAVVEDIGARKRAESSLKLLLEASSLLGSTLEVDRVLRAVPELLVPGYAAYCAVYVRNADGALETLAVRHADPATSAALGRLHGRLVLLPDAPRGQARVLRTGEPELVEQVTDEILRATIPDDEVRATIAALAPTSWMIVPMKGRGGVVGAISIAAGPASGNQRFDQIDLAFATDLGRRAAAALEHARLFAETRQLARDLERRVVERTAALATANAELASFAYSVSHDLRAPLRPLEGFAQALLEDHAGALSPEARRLLGRIAAAARRMSAMIDAMLILSRVTRADIRRVPIDLAPLAREILADLARRDPGRAVDVRVAPSLPASGDPELLRMALENLVGNAWKFTAHTPGARIEVGAQGNGGGPAFFVRDNGAGFDPAHMGKLFRPFQRLHAEAEFPGTGVGLATVQRIVARHGGRVWADGAPGRGATFSFTLGDDAHPEPPPRPLPSAAEASLP